MIDPPHAYNPALARYLGGRLTRHDRARMKLEGQAQQSAWMASLEGQSRREAAMAAAGLVVAAMPRRRPMRRRVVRAP